MRVRESKRSGSVEHKFVVPDLQGPSTGGTVFNAQLLTALSEMGVDASRLDEKGARDDLADPFPCYVWVDSLYLNELPTIHDNCNHSVGLLAHYLPSLVHSGDAVDRACLSPEEQRALDVADAFLVTSTFMRNKIENLSHAGRHILVVEPGRMPHRHGIRMPERNAVSAILVANLTPGKGIEPFLSELAAQVCEADDFLLKIVGRGRLDKPYALACERAVRSHPKLSRCVVFCGARSPEAVSEEISDSSLLVSASTMETFGMALAEARTIGVPILAVAGGNVRAHVEREAGGELVSTHKQLASSFLFLCRNQWTLTERFKAANRFATPPRSWTDTAKDYLTQVPPLAEPPFLQVQ